MKHVASTALPRRRRDVSDQLISGADRYVLRPMETDAVSDIEL